MASPVADHLIPDPKNLDIENLTTGNVYIKLGATALAIFALCFVYMTSDPIHPGFELVGASRWNLTYIKAKYKFLKQGRELVFEGLRKFKGKPFQVVGLNGPDIIFPGSYAKLVSNDRRFSFHGFVAKDFFPEYPGFEGPKASLDTDIIATTVRTKLTQSLGHVTTDLCDETEKSLHDIFGESEEWKDCEFNKVSAPLVARLSTRVFLGPVLATNKRWLEIAVSYTINIMVTSRLMKQLPNILRPLLYRFIPTWRTLNRDSVDARRIIDEEIERRKVKWEEDKRNGVPVAKMSDSLGWLQEVAGDRPFDMAGGQLDLTFAAIHTTSQLLSKCMFRLASNPEWIPELRKEMVSVLQENGWEKTSLYKMKLLDSFLKEVQRLDSGSVVSLHRVATAPVTLPNGLTIPKGAQVKVLLDAHTDPAVYPSPETFDPARYLRLRSQPGQENSWQFVTVSESSIGFGLGKHAYPGRFFASNEVKIALCWMLIKYDWELAEPLKPAWFLGTELMSDPEAKVRYRRRKEEIDLSAL